MSYVPSKRHTHTLAALAAHSIAPSQIAGLSFSSRTNDFDWVLERQKWGRS